MAKQYDESDFNQVVFRSNQEPVAIHHANDGVSQVYPPKAAMPQTAEYVEGYQPTTTANQNTPDPTKFFDGPTMEYYREHAGSNKNYTHNISDVELEKSVGECEAQWENPSVEPSDISERPKSTAEQEARREGILANLTSRSEAHKLLKPEAEQETNKKANRLEAIASLLKKLGQGQQTQRNKNDRSPKQ